MEMNNKRRRQTMIMYFIAGLVLAFALQRALFTNISAAKVEQVTYSKFVSMVEDGKVNSVNLNQSNNEISFKTDNKDISYVTTAWPNDIALTSLLKQHKVTFASTVDDKSSGMWIYLVASYLIPIALVWLGFWFLRRRLSKQMGDDGPSMNFGGGLGFGGVGKSGAKIVADKDNDTTFRDVAGQDEAKESLAEIVNFLEHPEKYAAIGARCPRGALLVGPPGTGKTLLAKAVAGEAKVPFFQIAGSEFVEMFVGRGAARVRDLFKQANEKAPCIVFIDEIDTIGKKRGVSLNSNDEREQTLNQLLTEMDGFDNHKGIVVLAATNQPDVLDPALLRPGRFDRRIPVELPDLTGRESILKLHSHDVKMESGVDFAQIARTTPGASGADLANMINEAALRAVRQGRKFVTQEDIEESVDTVIAGEKKKSTVLSEHEKEVVAYHETGHAIVAAVQDGKTPVSKITIVPRTSGALGFTMQAEEDERYLTTREEFKQRIAVLCGGRAAEELIFGHMSSGAANDIEKATKIARAMVTQLGMSDKFGMMALGERRNIYLGGGSELTCSEGTAREVDDEVRRLVEEGHQTALATLRENRFKLHEIAHYLQRKETITGEEFMNILSRNDGFAPAIVSEARSN